MTLLLGAVTIGLILSLLAMGVYVSFRIFNVPDITAEGSITLGASIAATMLVAGYDPVAASAAGWLGGTAAGATTGILHTKFRINALLSGILVMTALYSVNLHVMGKSNVPLMHETTLATLAEGIGRRVLGPGEIDVFGWAVGVGDASMLIGVLAFVGGAGAVLYMFFRTNVGTAMRAAGDNPQMIKALGVSVDAVLIAGLALANGLTGLAGAMLAQYQGFADVQMGIGMVVWGLASVIIGEALVGARSVGFMIVGAVMGSVLFRLLVAIALRWGLDPNDLKLMTALFVFAALVGPMLARHLRGRWTARPAV